MSKHIQVVMTSTEKLRFNETYVNNIRTVCDRETTRPNQVF